MSPEMSQKTAEDLLKDYRMVLHSIYHKIFYKDINSAYVLCNDKYALDLGVKSEEVLGMSDFDFFPRHLAEKYRADDRRIITNASEENFEEFYLANGQEIRVRTVKKPVLDEKGKVVGVVGLFWEILEREHKSDRLRR